MVSTQEEIILKIGEIFMRRANASAEKWDYAGYIFETADGINAGGTKFLFSDREQLPFNFGRDRREISELFKCFREVTRVEGDGYWIKCKAVLRKSDGKLKMLFEFDDWSRWSITPDNVDQAYEILVGDIFPEAFARSN